MHEGLTSGEQLLAWVLITAVAGPIIAMVGYTIYKQIKVWRTGKID